MTIIKCPNPRCDYFQRPIPPGDYCPFCGEPLTTTTAQSAIPRPILRLIHSSGQEYVIDGQIAYIGRQGGKIRPQPDIDLSDLPYSERVSRPHAHIFWDERSNSYLIMDDDSTNGTILNGTSLTARRTYPLTNGALLEFGREHLVKFTVSIELETE